MLFNSLNFLYFFLPITYVGFWLLKSKNSRFVWLTLTGYWFYATWNWKFVFLMFFSTIVSYLAGRLFLKYSGSDPDTQKIRKRILLFPIVIDLLLLGFFKYFNFIVISADQILELLKFQSPLQPLDIILPVGISFYTFHTISYIVDSYRRVITPTKNFWEFSCYVSLFSQLVAGPIVRFGQIEDSLERVDVDGPLKNFNRALGFFIIGLAKKVLIADNLAESVHIGFANAGALSFVSAWLTALAYTFQLYFDFSGYSDMAVGLALLFNLDIPQNFNSPYKARNFSDFWKRWHISLSTCIRDYIYIPLGGSRFGRTSRNLLIAMGIGGLWHGANWTFIIWGLYHGGLLVGEKFLADKGLNLPSLPKRATVFLLAVLGWVVFRADNVSQAGSLLKNMTLYSGEMNLPALSSLVCLVLLCFAITQFAKNAFEDQNFWTPIRGPFLVLLFLMSLTIIFGGQSSPFLYFQF